MPQHRIINLLWIFFEKFGLILLSIVSFFVFALYLSPAELGIAALALAIVETYGTIYIKGLQDPLVRSECQSKDELTSVFWLGSASVVITTLIVSALIWLIQPTSLLWQIVAFGSLKIVFSVMARPFIAKLRCQRQFKTMAIRTIFGKVVGALAGIVAAMTGAGAWSLIVQAVVMEAIALLILYYTDRKLISGKPTLRLYLAVVKEGIPIGFRGLVDGLLGKGTVMILSLVTSPTIVGYYAFARRLVDLPKEALRTGLVSYVLPVFVSRKNDQAKLSQLFINLTVSTCLICVPIFIGFGITGSQFITPVFGEKWAGASEIFTWVAIIAGINLAHIYTTTLQAAMGKSYVGIMSDLLRTGLVLLLIFLLTPQFDLIGVVIALWVNMLLSIFIRFYAAQKVLPILNKTLIMPLATILIASCLMAVIATWFMSNMSTVTLQLSLSISVSIIFYILVLQISMPNWFTQVRDLMVVKR